MHVITHRLCVALWLVTLLAGCKPKTPAELAVFQGDWQFDEAGYVDSLRERSTNTNALKEELNTYRDMKAYGVSPMPDIRIAASRIRARDDRPRVLYDLVDVRSQNDGVAAKAHFFSDERGAMVTLDFLLTIRGTNLLLRRTEAGLGDTYVFTRK